MLLCLFIEIEFTCDGWEEDCDESEKDIAARHDCCGAAVCLLLCIVYETNAASDAKNDLWYKE